MEIIVIIFIVLELKIWRRYKMEMEMNIKVERIKELTEELINNSHNYYVLDNPSISDKEYDVLYTELEILEKETGFIEHNSPTQRVGDITLAKFKKVPHKNKLWSLDKSQSKEEMKDFYNYAVKFCKQHNLPTPKFVVSKKFDGLSLCSEYDNQGILQQSSSRGTGEIGEDLTLQSKTIVNLPHQINSDYVIHVHGEVLMTKRSFTDYNKSSEIPLKNLRNGASGAMRQLNIKECARRKLSAFFYNINYIEGKEFETYSQQLDFIKNIGLPTAEYVLCDTFEEISTEIDNIESQKPNLEYDIDGSVVSVDDIKTREMMGFTVKFPRYSNAYKYEAEETTTTLLDVEFNTGRTGKITPRAIIEPVELAGATVNYATLNNMDDIARKNVKLGGRVFIRRSNEVIPEIMGNADDEGIEILPPTHCKSCGSELIKDGVHYFCPISLSCNTQLVKAVVHYCQREALNIVGFSEQGASLFFEHGIIKNILDLYSLESKKEQIINLPKFKVKKYENLIKSVNESKLCDLSAFIYGLGIENCGKKSGKDLAKRFKTIDNFRNCTREELISIDDIGDTTADSVTNWLYDGKNEILLDELLKFITFKEDIIMETKSSVSLEGMVFVITGKVELYKNRAELQGVIEGLGGKVSGTVSAKTNYLITDDTESGTGKNKRAKELNIPIINEISFNEMIK